MPAAASSINFDGLADGDAVTTQYAGVLFSNTMIAGAGISLNELEFPPMSGTNVAFDDGGPITITFSEQISNFSAFFTYTSRLTVLAFDAANTVIASDISAFSTNLACLAGPPCAGDAGSIPNELLEIASPSGQISYITISGLPSGASFVMDDVTFTSVPEPSTLLFILSGGGVILEKQRRRGSRVPDSPSPPIASASSISSSAAN